jgi:hypothetical protein
MTEPNQKLPNQTIHKLLIRFSDFAASPVILALVIKFVLFWFLPPQVKFNIASEDVAFSNYINELRNYEDLNGNGETELLKPIMNFNQPRARILDS